MPNNIAWPLVSFIQRSCIILTVASCVYIAFFLLSKAKEIDVSDVSADVSEKDPSYLPPPPVVDVKSYDITNSRDVFSLASEVGPSGVVDKTPKGELPQHLKVVGVMVSHPSQIIIEDTFLNKTFFISEGETQDGIKIAEVDKNQMIINYQGEDITVPIKQL